MMGLVALAGYASLTGAAVGPNADLAHQAVAQTPAQAPSIRYVGTDPIITGSVSNLFSSGGFAGPNRASKTDRMRPQVDVLSVARSFEQTRLRLAALRLGPADPKILGQNRIADAAAPKPDDIEGPRISVAAIDPTSSGALNAIAALVPTADAPSPALASAKLAYARASAPVTGEFATTEKVSVSDKQLWCLSTAIYFEARGENYRGQVAVAQVVMNRTKAELYPSTICGVVFQNQSRRNACQFSFACDGIPERITEPKAWKQAQEIARKVVDGELYLTEVADATHYHATYVRPDWARRMQRVTQVGMHVFYKFKNGWLFG
ncbi:cell wall hydrolase [Devosia rhodophyticola]|uniref:Cell wall hydrolase n=1 Tax=Devosia rhodophyticola TaxID=3026423 RepID=A0ABY7YUY3_9HYPH|nr:cell wall hydrolase [Devosia rhodophyticola]WDR05114.1 cell wall hydrolase [Devosia rhodophyticola]